MRGRFLLVEGVADRTIQWSRSVSACQHAVLWATAKCRRRGRCLYFALSTLRVFPADTVIARPWGIGEGPTGPHWPFSPLNAAPIAHCFLSRFGRVSATGFRGGSVTRSAPGCFLRRFRAGLA